MSWKSKYKQLLNHGLRGLEIFMGDPSKSGDTGLEEHLTGHFLEDIYVINQYMYTTASTNYPADPTFQAMFIDGLIEKKLGEYLISRLPKSYYYLVIDIENNEIVDSRLPKPGGDYLLNETFNEFNEYQTNAYMLYEIPEFVDSSLIKHLYKIIIEDSVHKRRTLYGKILEILEETN